MDSDKNAIAVFAPLPKVTVEKRDREFLQPATGTVSSAPAGISCGETCTAAVLYGKPLTLQATENEGWIFDRWENCTPVEGKPQQCTLSPTADITVAAVYGQKPRKLIVEKVDPGGGSVFGGKITSSSARINCHPDCEADFINIATVQLTASDADGWSFVRWHADSEACANSTNTVCDVPMTKDVNRVKAVFSPGPRTLTVQRVKESNNNETAPGGRIVSDPAGIDCGSGADCEGDFEYGTWAVVKAMDENDWVFVKWADDNLYCAGSTNRSCLVRMNDNRSLKAVFKEGNIYTFFFSATGPDYRLYQEMEEYQSGDAVTVYNRMKYDFGLKLDGQPVRVFYYGEDCCESWPLHSFPTMEYGMTDHYLPGYEFTLRDLTNGRDVTFNIDLTISNEGYRNIQGRTLDIKDQGGRIVTVTFESFPEGQQTGTLRQQYPDGNVYLGTWDMTGNSGVRHWQRIVCEAGEQIVPVWGVTRNNPITYGINVFDHIGPGHVWVQGNWHFCPEWAEYRRVLNDH
jgi:hypothetical protein